MPSALPSFIKKEIKDLLRDPKILFSVIILPALIYAVMGQGVSFAITKTAEESAEISMLIIDEDGGDWSRFFLDYLGSIEHLKLEVLRMDEANSLPQDFEEGELDCIIIIPNGFSLNITSGLSARLEITMLIKSLGITSLSKMDAIGQIVREFSRNVVASYLANAYPDRNITSILNPIIQERSVIIKNQRYPESVGYMLSNQGFLFIIGPILVLSVVISIAATSMGVEKEEKTLEVLLSLPLRRSDIIIGKTVATAVISVLGAISLSVGLFIYMASILSYAEVSADFGTSIRPLIELLGPSNLIKVGIGLVLCLLLGSVLGLIVASFASNVREAQALANVVWMPVLVVFVVLMFVDLDAFSASSQVILSLLPFSSPIIVLKTAFQESAHLSDISILVNFLYFVLAIWLSIRWFDSERILTARPSLKLRGKKD